MQEGMQQPEKRKQMPNLACHLYWSLAKLQIESSEMWNELDKVIRELVPQLQLKNIATLLEGIGKRQLGESKEPEEESLISLLHERFMELYNPATDSPTMNEED